MQKELSIATPLVTRQTCSRGGRCLRGGAVQDRHRRFGGSRLDQPGQFGAAYLAVTVARSRSAGRARTITTDHGSARVDRGSVTVEAALVLAVLMVVVASCLAGIGCVIAQLRCADAAREAARLAGRGDTASAATAVTAIAPSGAVLSLQNQGDLVTATVSVGAVSGLLPGVTITATASAANEERAQLGRG